jgi:uncharacterized protein YidB (DUF937 family)
MKDFSRTVGGPCPSTVSREPLMAVSRGWPLDAGAHELGQTASGQVISDYRMYRDGYKSASGEGSQLTESQPTEGKRMALTDILNKLGGQKGEQGGLAAISKLFDADGMQGILSKLQASGLDKQVMSWIGHGQNEPVTGDDIKNAVNPQQLSQVAQQSGMSQDEVADHVAQALPETVDKATPGGAVPKQGFSMESLTGMFKK